MIRYFIFLLLLLSSSPVFAEENLFNSFDAIRKEAAQIGEEAAQVAVAPVRPSALPATFAVAGAVGLLYSFDEDIRSKVLGIKGNTLDDATDAGSFVGSPYLHLGAAALVYGGGIVAGSEKYRSLGEMLGESLILADAATFLLKQGIGRGRPSTGGDKGDFKPFRFARDYDSLPSMHTASSFAVASVLARTTESASVGWLSYTAATFVGFSRIYQDKHWASDVVLGAAIGELCGRVVTSYHADKSMLPVTITPAASTTGASLLVSGHF